ncbi:hypothetical protein ACJMK2_036642 [Sinanodonta woodiana]|uniref:TOG domain-containing protein n=1 Tax=Sinanodonta woodiana TaxID=1069815 RepID=A0ABD3WHU8_SINWO
MAGKVAKVHVAKFPLHDFNEAQIIDHRSTGIWNMEENDVLEQLKDQSFKKRIEILEQLLLAVRRNGGRLPYANVQAIFRGLGLVLQDTNWDVRLKCIQLINEVIPMFGESLDACMLEVLGRLIANMGDQKITVRRQVIQTLHVYMKFTSDVQSLHRAIVSHGLEHEDPRVRKEAVVALPMLFTPEFSRENFFEITQSLAKKLLDTSVEDNLRDSSLMTLEKIRNLVGEKEFNLYLQKLSAPLRRYYQQLTGHTLPEPSGDTTSRSNAGDLSNRSNVSSGAAAPGLSKPGILLKSKQPIVNGTVGPNGSAGPPKSSHIAQYVDSYEFGIIPSHIMSQINDQENFKLRAKGVEELKNIMQNVQEGDIQSHLMPHMIPFISFLNNLLDDSNFKITTVTLEILCLLVEQLGADVKQFLKQLSSTLTKRMGDNKIVVRQAVMKVAIKMMQALTPKPVLSVICENLQHRNSRVRQETLNIIIAALLTFPSYSFDLPVVCRMVAPLLVDVKRQVRQAALECLAAIAQTMGSGRLQPLVQAVDQVELSSEGEGVMGAVQARLARRQLPRLNSEGLVEYATPVPSSASTRSSASHHSQGADMDWIMGSSSRGLTRSDTMELESVQSSNCTTPLVGMPESTSSNRPFLTMSAGRGLKKLPWQDDSHPKPNGHFQDGPPKPRQTWSTDEGPVQQDFSASSPPKKPFSKKQASPAGFSFEDPLEATSYKQIHLGKLKKQASGPSKTSSFRTDFVGTFGTERVDQDDDHDDSKPAKEEDSPIPLKATIARSATRRNKKVPPLAASFPKSKDDDADSAYAPSLESTLEAESKNDMLNSLASIRNSASKKKTQKITEKHSNHPSLSQSRSPSPENLRESGVFSNYSSQKDTDSEDSLSFTSKSKKTESPFEVKPKLARTGSIRKKNDQGQDDSNSLGIGNGTTIKVDYNPVSGVTFRENKNSDVHIVGKGYNEDGVTEPSKPFVGSISIRAKDRIQKQKLNKGSVLSPLGVASMHSLGSLELEEDKVPSPDSIGVIGKGMFDNVNGTEHAITAGNSQSQERQDKKPIKQEKKDVPGGVFGIKVNRSGSQDDTGIVNIEDLEDETDSIGLGKQLKERIAQAQQQKQEEAEKKRAEKEKTRQEHEEKLKKERERQQEKLRRLNTSESLGIESLSISGSGSSTPKTRASPSLTPRKKSRSQMDVPSQPHPLSASSRSLVESDNPEDWKPFKDAEQALRDSQRMITQDSWEIKCSGINMMRKLARFHPDVLRAQLHPIIILIQGEVKNLRSQVSRLAITCMGDMFIFLGKSMDSDLDNAVRTLLHKNGESNSFIREDVEKALDAMVENVAPQRAMLSLVAGGAAHKNSQVRKTTSYYLGSLLEKMGPGRVLSGVKDVTDKIIPAIAHFVSDGSQETRYNGRKMLFLLMNHPDFDKMIDKHLPSNTVRNVREIVENLKVKGLGSESSSARGWRSGHGSRSSSVIRGSSASSENLNAPKRPIVRTDEATQEEIKQIQTLLTASDWRERYKGITQLLENCETNVTMISNNVVKIFDKFLPKLQDPNSKVNLYALQVMLQIVPILGNNLSAVISMAVGNVAPNLSSKNKEIYVAAMEVINAFMEHIDGSVLIQPMANQAQAASARSKPDLVEKVAELVDKVYPKKQKQVALHVLPLLWHLLGATNSSGALQGGSSNIRTATTTLINVLHVHMGSTLIERAQAEPNVTQRHIQLLQELIEHH